MESFYVLLLDRQTNNTLSRLRRTLFAQTGDGSFCSLEPCIILGPASDGPLASFLPCPQLPIAVEGQVKYERGFLYLPIDERRLEPIRQVLGTSYPISGIHLGYDEVACCATPFFLRSLDFAILDVNRQADLVQWRVHSRKHLDSDRES